MPDVGRFVSQYLRSEDLKGKGDVVATIASAAVEVVGRGEDAEERLVLYFQGLEQGFIPSKTSLKQLCAIFESTDTDDWLGKKVILYHDPGVVYAGKTVGGIRVRSTSTQSKK